MKSLNPDWITRQIIIEPGDEEAMICSWFRRTQLTPGSAALLRNLITRLSLCFGVWKINSLYPEISPFKFYCNRQTACIFFGLPSTFTKRSDEFGEVNDKVTA